MSAELLYLDHAATTPLLPAARAALLDGLERWANPSSPHRAGREARALLEDARARLKALLGWTGEVVFTSGASEALALAIRQSKAPLSAVSAVEHEAVLRHRGAALTLPVGPSGLVDPDACAIGGLVAVQQVNNETGVIQSVDEIAVAVHAAGGVLLSDCAQAAGKLDLPAADLIALSAHKFGGPVGVGALLVRDWNLLTPVGGQERGYRAGTENLPGVMAMVAALESGRDWIEQVARQRAELERALVEMGGDVIAAGSSRLPVIGAYRMPGLSAAAQLIRFDAQGIALSAGSACSSGSLRTSHVLSAMGLDDRAAGEVIRVSLGRETTERDLKRFLAAWTGMAAGRP